MHFLSRRYLCFTGLTFGLSVLLAPLAGVLAADDYRIALEAEAADTGRMYSYTASDTKNNHKSASRKVVLLQKAITPGLDFDQFGEELHSRYSGTHLLYMKLSVRNRKAIWKHYQKDNALSAVRERIVSLMSSS